MTRSWNICTENKLVALWTKSSLWLACCCSLVLLLEHPGEQSKILRAAMTIDIRFCVARPTYPPTYSVWSWKLGSSQWQFTWRHWHLVFNPGYYLGLRQREKHAQPLTEFAPSLHTALMLPILKEAGMSAATSNTTATLKEKTMQSE